MNFQDLWNKFFLFIFGQLCDKKTFAFVVMGIGKKNLCGLEVGWAEIIRQTVSFLLVCVCVCVCVCLWGGGWAGFGIIRHQMLLFYDHFHYCEIFLARFLISFVFKKAVIAFGY